MFESSDYIFDFVKSLKKNKKPKLPQGVSFFEILNKLFFIIYCQYEAMISNPQDEQENIYIQRIFFPKYNFYQIMEEYRKNNKKFKDFFNTLIAFLQFFEEVLKRTKCDSPMISRLIIEEIDLRTFLILRRILEICQFNDSEKNDICLRHNLSLIEYRKMNLQLFKAVKKVLNSEI